jgi:cytidine deaminase
MPEPLDREDAKIITLARAARGRAYAPYTGVAEGAAVRDTDGRTYAAASVEHRDPALAVSALRAAVAAAAGSGARRFEAAAVVTEADALRPEDLAMIAEFTSGAVVFRAAPDGTVREQARA